MHDDIHHLDFRTDLTTPLFEGVLGEVPGAAKLLRSNALTWAKRTMCEQADASVYTVPELVAISLLWSCNDAVGPEPVGADTDASDGTWSEYVRRLPVALSLGMPEWLLE